MSSKDILNTSGDIFYIFEDTRNTSGDIFYALEDTRNTSGDIFYVFEDIRNTSGDIFYVFEDTGKSGSSVSKNKIEMSFGNLDSCANSDEQSHLSLVRTCMRRAVLH